MGGGVRLFPPLIAAMRRPLIMTVITLASLWPTAALAQGSLQDLVGTYSLTEKTAEGDWCANVPMDVANMSSLDVTAVDDDSVSIAMGGSESFELPFDSSARTFRYDVSQSGYDMSITGQFVRGRDNVAMAMVYSWQPQIDCVASVTGSKSAPDLGYGESATAAGVTPGGDWGWLENPIVLALLALLMALTAAGVAFSRGRSDSGTEPAPESEPVSDGVGGGGAGLAGLAARSIAPLSGMTTPPLVAPVSGLDPLLHIRARLPKWAEEDPRFQPTNVPEHVFDDLHGYTEADLDDSTWKWLGGKRVNFSKDGSDRIVYDSTGAKGEWVRINDGSLFIIWKSPGGETTGFDLMRVSEDHKFMRGTSGKVDTLLKDGKPFTANRLPHRPRK